MLTRSGSCGATLKLSLRGVRGYLKAANGMKDTLMRKKTGCADEVYYDVTMTRYAQQFQQVDALDHKFANILTLGNGVLAVFVSVLAFRGDDIQAAGLTLLGLGVAAYAAMMYFGFQAYVMRPFSMRPDLDTLKQHCEDQDNPTMRMWVGDECITSMKDNEDRIKEKTCSAKLAIAFLAVEVVLLAAAVVSTLA